MFQRHKFKCAAFAAVLSSSLWVVPAGAAMIKVNGTTVLSDNFNMVASGGNDANLTKAIADVGAWDTTSQGTNNVVFNATQSSPPAPGPNEGDGYLRLAFQATTGGRHSGSFPMVSGVGDVVTFTTMVYVPSISNGDAHHQLLLGTSTTAPMNVKLQSPANSGTLPLGTSARLAGFDGSAFVPSSTYITYDKWQQWDLTYTIGSSMANTTLTWLVDGAGGPMQLNLTTTPNVNNLLWITNAAATNARPIYWDAVPEPSGLAVLALTGAVAGIRRRRAPGESLFKLPVR